MYMYMYMTPISRREGCELYPATTSYSRGKKMRVFLCILVS